MQYLWIELALKIGKYVDTDLEYQMKLCQQLGRSFPYKISPHTKHNWHCTIGLSINAATLNVYVITFHEIIPRNIRFASRIAELFKT